MCLLEWCCCGCSLSTAAKGILLVDLFWLILWGVWSVLATIFLKTVNKINTDYITDNPDDQNIVTTLLWSILIVSLATPLIGMIAFFTNFKPRQVLAYFVARVLGEVGHLALFVCYLSYIGSKDLIGCLITFCWLATCVYLNWVLLSYFLRLMQMQRIQRLSELEMSKKMCLTMESFNQKGE